MQQNEQKIPNGLLLCAKYIERSNVTNIMKFISVFDKNKDGFLTKEEFVLFLKMCYPQISLQDIELCTKYTNRESKKNDRFGTDRIAQAIRNAATQNQKKTEQEQLRNQQLSINQKKIGFDIVHKVLSQRPELELEKIFNKYDFRQEGYLDYASLGLVLASYFDIETIDMEEVKVVYDKLASTNNFQGIKILQLKQLFSSTNYRAYFDQNQQQFTQSQKIATQQQIEKAKQTMQENKVKAQGDLIYEEYLRILEDNTIYEYQDPEFPLDASTIGAQYKAIPMRSRDLFGGQLNIFTKTTKEKFEGLNKYLNSDEIKQGNVGDCYFLAAIGALVDSHPRLIIKCFKTLKVNEKGIYCLRLFVNGEQKTILLDDYFPAAKKQRLYYPAFSKSMNNELWVMLLEKAWAKLSGGYEEIDAGHCREGLRLLTGAPTKHMRTNKPNFLEMLTLYIQSQFILTAAVTEQSGYNLTVLKKLGLVSNHAYSILDVIMVEHYERGQVVLLKLRNPWAKVEWKGDWSLWSPLWTPELRKKYLDDSRVGQGAFFIDIDNFIKFFSLVDVCLVHPEYKYDSIRVTSTKWNGVYCLMEISEPGTYYISVHQPNKRLLFVESGYSKEKVKELEKYEYSSVKIIISELVSVEKQEYNFIKEKSGLGAEVYCKTFLNPGICIVYVKVSWLWSEYSDFVLTSYGPFNVQLTITDKIKDFKEKSLLSKSSKEKNR